MPDSEYSCWELSENVWIWVLIIIVPAHKLLHIFPSDQLRKVLVISDMLEETDNIVSCDLIDILIWKFWVSSYNKATKPIVLSDKNCMENCQSHILIESKITSLKFSVLIFRKKISLTDFHSSIFKLSQRISSCFIRTVNLTAINPGCNDVNICSDFRFGACRTSEIKLLFSCTFFVKMNITFWDFDVKWLCFVASCRWRKA